MFSHRWTFHRIHKWMGLVAAVWLIVLGLTGFLLDHRDTWRWLWQGGVSEALINKNVTDKSKSGQIRLYQINSSNSLNHIAGGLTGLWWSKTAGKDWLKTDFIGVVNIPMVSAVLFSTENNVWIASDNGIWLSLDGGETASIVTLMGEWISALSLNEKNNEIIGVIGRSKIFNYSIKENKTRSININPVTSRSLPSSISLSRFTRDIHYGRGVFDIPLSLLWNDVTAVAMVILPLSGFLFYWLPKRWKRNIHKKKISHRYKKQTIRWLFRLHGPTFGLVCAIPLIYLSLTGILLDHAKGLRTWMKSTEITREWQTPVYDLKSWDGEIYGIVNYSNNNEKFSLGTRLGLFTTTDNGRTWKRDRLLSDQSMFVWTLRRAANSIYVGGMGSPNMKKTMDKPWSIVKGVGHMPSDVTVDAKGYTLWKSRHGLKSSLEQKNTSFPHTNYVPWFYVIDGLHSGVLIHSQWKWFNDFIAVISILLVITGLIRWWRKKWI